MSQEELYHTIEQYLEGSLDADALDRFNRRLENEPDLVKEVALHRSMQEALENPMKLKLRTNLSQLRKEFTITEAPSTLPQKKSWRIIGIIAIGVLCFSALLWFLTQDASPAEPTQEISPSEVVSTEDEIAELNEVAEPQVAPLKPTNRLQGNQAKNTKPDTEIIQTNPFFEKLLEGHAQVKGFEVDIEYPFQDERFTRADQFINFRIRGALETSDSRINEKLSLVIFNDQSTALDIGQAMITFKLELNKEVEDDEEEGLAFATKELYFFDTSKKIDLMPGVYYYALVSDLVTPPLHITRFKVSN